MRSMGGCSKAEKNGSSIRKMAFLRKIPLCHHDSRKYRGCDVYKITPTSYKCESKSAARFNRLAAFSFAKILSQLLTCSQIRAII